MKAASNATRPKYVCGNDRIKLIGTTDGGFPDFGHHLEKEMGGLWLYPVKLLDGFWMKVKDETAKTVDGYIFADRFENFPHKNVFYYGNGMGHTPVTIRREQIAPDHSKGIRVTYTFCLPARESQARKLEATFLVRVNLRPDWLAEEMGLADGSRDEIVFDPKEAVFTGKDNQNPWTVMIGTPDVYDSYETGDLFGPEETGGNGTGVSLHFSFVLSPGEKKTLTFFIAGEIDGPEKCLTNYRQLIEMKDCEREKADRIEGLLAASRLQIKDRRFMEIFDWVKVHTDWLTLETEGIGRGIVAGIPEYVWWFGCDSCYALQGIMMQGNFELCRSTIELILDYSQRYNGNGRIVHEILPNGFSPNLGNVQETAHFIYLLWEYYEWTGDQEILERAFPYLEKSVRWLMAADDDGDGFPTGYGIIEIAGLNMEMIDTAAYTAAAYECYVRICRLLAKEEEIPFWEEKARETKEAVRTRLWSEEEGLFFDCYASTEKIEEKKEMVLDQMREAGDEQGQKRFLEQLSANTDKKAEKGWLLNKNWVINVPMEVGLADEKQAQRALARMHTDEFIGEYGMYLEGLRKNAVMTISTGVMAVAQARYGYEDRALELIRRIMKSFSVSTPGSLSEMSPDYGCFVQAWTAYGVMVPVVRYFFGIQPDAAAGTITIAPDLPAAWEEGSLTDVRVLDGSISIEIKKVNGKRHCVVKNETSARILLQGEFDKTEIQENRRKRDC